MDEPTTRLPTGLDAVVENLVRAARARRLGTGRAWDYGWSDESYRRSPSAAMTHDLEHTVSLSPDGVLAFEAAVNALLRRPDIKAAWSPSDLWAMVANMVGTLPFDDVEGAVERRMARLASAGPTLTVFAVANLRWAAAPLVGRDFVLGRAGPTWRREVTQAAQQRPTIGEGEELPWQASNPDHDAEDAPVLFASWSDAQSRRAQKAAASRFEDLFTLCLLLGPDPASYEQYSLRGDALRPGIRGLTLHRPALEQAGQKMTELADELAAPIFQRSTLTAGVTHNWWGGQPFPLDQVMSAPNVRSLVLDVLAGDRAVHSRVRAAARWHSKAHWSLASEDAVLALGVGFDSLLSERAGLPGRAVTERFALLEPDPTLRAARAKLFSEIYSARSSVAHGGRASVLDRPNFAREVAHELRSTAHRFLEVAARVGATGDSEIAEMFESLRWGTLR